MIRLCYFVPRADITRSGDVGRKYETERARDKLACVRGERSADRNFLLISNDGYLLYYHRVHYRFFSFEWSSCLEATFR